ncbi:TonB-dependent receptor domain-containing protein [Sphingobacterium multivorum]|uniref:TonB-dependent receptor n=1 Tax=Sphingobacterium multivorum TaxID=28454 RepID=UPI003DA369EA
MKFKQYVTQNDIKFMIRTSLVGLFLSIVSAEMLLASGAYGQLLNKKITVSFSESNIPAAFERLESENIHIAFDAAKYNLAKKKVNAKIFKSSSVRDVMRYLLRETDLMAQDNSVYITLVEKPVQQNGYISGKVIDDRGQPLANASIKLIGTNKSTQSGIDGSYLLNAEPGTYILEVSYLSYQTQRIEGVKIQSGQRTGLNIAMKTQVNALETAVVNVSFKKASVAGLYAAQKNAASVTDGISAEQIARTPDNDMGQVLKRVTGLTTVNNRNVIVRGMSDRYNQAMLDGVVIPSTSQNRRDFSFDIIPTEMVSSVVVNKTATPDVSAEFSGGQVSVNTLDIPEKNFTTIQYGIGGNSRTTGKDFYRLGERKASEFFGFNHSSSKQPEGILPWYWNGEARRLDAPPGYVLDDPKLNEEFLMPGSDVKYNDIDAISQSKQVNADAMKLYRYKANPNQNFRFALGRRYNLSNGLLFGFSASANIRNEQNIVAFNNVRGSAINGAHYIDSTGVGLNGAGTSYRFNSSSGLVANFGLQGQDFKLAFKNIYARTYNNSYNENIRAAFADLSNAPTKNQYQLPEAMSLQQHQLSGEYKLPWKIKAEGMFAYNKIKQQILDERKLRYRLTTVFDDQHLFQTPNLLNLSGWSNSSVLGKDSRMWTQINEDDYNWAMAFSRIFGEGRSVSTLVKVGYQGWSKKRDLSIFRLLPFTRSYMPNDPSTAAPAIEAPYDVLFSSENIGNGIGQAYYYPELIGGNVYDGSMQSHAGYFMLDQKLWNKLRLVYGVRAEYYNLKNRQDEMFRKQNGDPNDDKNKFIAYKLLVRENNWKFLPSINATYSVTNTFNVRGSYSKTAIRPDFRETGFFGFYDFELDAIISGDNVESTFIDNVDLRLEWYPSPGEIISLTGFYKYLDKPIELVEDESFTGGAYYVFNNMESAKNNGLEFEIRKNLSFIGDKDWLTNFFISANATLLSSKVNVLSSWKYKIVDGKELPERIKDRSPGQDRPLIGQSPWLLNLGIGYWGNSFGTTVSYNHRGYRTNITSIDPNRVEYVLAPKQLDLQIYKRFLNNKLEAKLNMANLLDDWTRYYQNTEGYSVGNENGIYTIKKFKGDNRYNKADGDIITYRKKEGRRFNLSLTYNF